MDITEIRMFLCNEPRLKATLSVTFDDVFVVKGVKVIQGKHGLFVAMPSRKAESSFEDVCHPVNRRFRELLEDTVMREYSKLSGVPFDEVERMMRDSRAAGRSKSIDGQDEAGSEEDLSMDSDDSDELETDSDSIESKDPPSRPPRPETHRPGSARPARRPERPEDGDDSVPSIT